MSQPLTPETISQLETLIEADPALLAQLQSCTDAASSAAIVAKAAAAKGIHVTESDLVAHIEAELPKQADMSDAELDQVAGGSQQSALSILTLGVGCAIKSLIDRLQRRAGCM